MAREGRGKAGLSALAQLILILTEKRRKKSRKTQEMNTRRKERETKHIPYIHVYDTALRGKDFGMRED